MISTSVEYSCYARHAATDSAVERVAMHETTTNENSSFPVPNLATIGSIEDVLPATKVSQNRSDVPEPLEWTRKLEDKFNRLAQRKALNELSLTGNLEFEKLSAYRRQLKNPRTGEEVIAEFEQRMLTRNLVQALADYVNWHKQYATNNSR